jgi:hypothetical protein
VNDPAVAASVRLDRDHVAAEDIVLDHELAKVGEEPRRGLGIDPDDLHRQPGHRPVVLAAADEHDERTRRAFPAGEPDSPRLESGPRERRVEAELDVRELEARKLLPMQGQLYAVDAEVLVDSLGDGTVVALRFLEHLADEPAEIGP